MTMRIRNGKLHPWDHAPAESGGAEQVGNKFAFLVDRAKAATADHPKAALGVALAVGVVLGWIIKRR